MTTVNQLMACKLTLESSSETNNPVPVEWEFQENEVIIGRGNQCQLLLEDSTKVVSKFHALIKQEKGQYFLIDKGSMNGTLLDGVRLNPEQSFPLPSGSRIGIAQRGEDCAFTLRFEVDAHVSSELIDSNDHPTVSLESFLLPANSLVDEIQEEYWSWVELSEEIRQEKLGQFIRDKIQKMNSAEAEEALCFIEASFSSSDEPSMKSLANQHIPSIEMPQKHSYSNVRHHDLEKIRTYLETLAGLPLSAMDEQKIMELDKRLVGSVKLILEFIMTAVNGRRRFEQQMGIQVTSIFSKKHNPMKWTMSAEELGATLFDVDKESPSSDQVLIYLQEMLKDITQHQQGAMEGLRECVGGVLEELHPDKINETFSERTFFQLRTLFPGLDSWFIGAVCWKQYQDSHKSLFEEEQMLMERIIRPYFEKGYLRAHSPNSKES